MLWQYMMHPYGGPKVVCNYCPEGILLIVIMKLLLIGKKCFSAGVNQMKNKTATTASVKHKCYSLTTLMHYLKTSKAIIAEAHVSRLPHCAIKT